MDRRAGGETGGVLTLYNWLSAKMPIPAGLNCGKGVEKPADLG